MVLLAPADLYEDVSREPIEVKFFGEYIMTSMKQAEMVRLRVNTTVHPALKTYIGPHSKHSVSFLGADNSFTFKAWNGEEIIELSKPVWSKYCGCASTIASETTRALCL